MRAGNLDISTTTDYSGSTTLTERKFIVSIEDRDSFSPPSMSPVCLHVFTDGSKSPAGTGAGYVVYFPDEREPHVAEFSLDPLCSVFQSEVAAIHQAALYLRSLH